MASVAQDTGMTLSPFERMYWRGAEGVLLTDMLYAVPAQAEPHTTPETPEAVTPQVLAIPNRAHFEALVERWRHDIRFDSFPHDMKEHESFQEIVAEGFAIVPLIASHLRRRPSFLFLALEEIFQEDPVPEDAYGRLSSVAAAWLEWLQR